MDDRTPELIEKYVSEITEYNEHVTAARLAQRAYVEAAKNDDDEARGLAAAERNSHQNAADSIEIYVNRQLKRFYGSPFTGEFWTVVSKMRNGK